MRQGTPRFWSLPLILAVALPRVGRAANGAGTTSGDFLEIDVSPRAAALSGAVASLPDGGYSIATNPAGLAAIKRQEFSFAHHEHVSGVRREWLSYARPLRGNGTLAVSLDALYVEPFASYDQYDRPLGKTSSSDMALHAAYARDIRDTFSIGVAGGVVRSSLHDRSATAFKADAGVIFQPAPRTRLGISARNYGTALTYISEPQPLPLTWRTGLSVDVLEDEEKRNTLKASVDAITRRYRDTIIAGGVEYVYAGILALRAGGRTRSDSGPGWTIGAGLTLDRPEKRLPSVSFDYALADMGDLSVTHRVGVTVRWGDVVTAASSSAQRRAPAVGPQSDDPLSRLERARALIEQGRLDPAKAELEAALATIGERDHMRIPFLERLGRIALARNELPQARENYVAALRLAAELGLRDTVVAEAFAGMGEYLLAVKDRAHAERFFLKSLEVGPSPDTRDRVRALLDRMKDAGSGERQ